MFDKCFDKLHSVDSSCFSKRKPIILMMCHMRALLRTKRITLPSLVSHTLVTFFHAELLLWVQVRSDSIMVKARLLAWIPILLPHHIGAKGQTR